MRPGSSLSKLKQQHQNLNMNIVKKKQQQEIPTKEEFLEDGQLVTKLKEKVIAVKDIGYVDEHGLKLLVEASQEDALAAPDPGQVTLGRRRFRPTPTFVSRPH